MTSRFVIQNEMFNACSKDYSYPKTLSKSLVPYSDLRKEIVWKLELNTIMSPKILTQPS